MRIMPFVSVFMSSRAHLFAWNWIHRNSKQCLAIKGTKIEEVRVKSSNVHQIFSWCRKWLLCRHPSKSSPTIRDGAVYISTLYPSLLTSLILIRWNPFYDEFLFPRNSIPIRQLGLSSMFSNFTTFFNLYMDG